VINRQRFSETVQRPTINNLTRFISCRLLDSFERFHFSKAQGPVGGYLTFPFVMMQESKQPVTLTSCDDG
jgi:hypothetical protein